TGTPHAARAQDTVSLHITIGINQLTWRGLLERTVAHAAEQEPATHLPAGYLDDPASLSEGLAQRLEALAARIRDTDATESAEREVRRFLTSRPSRLEGGLVDSLAEITDATRLQRRPGH